MKVASFFILFLMAACHSSSDTAEVDRSGEDSLCKTTPLELSSSVLNFDTQSSSASYNVVFQGQWNEECIGFVPSSAHFTSLVVSSISDRANLWQPGLLASDGLERLAEFGVTSAYSAEIDSAITRNEALEQKIISIPFGGEAMAEFIIDFNRDFPSMNFASMIAPSSDWFVGLSKQSFLDEEGGWISSLELQLKVYDAGSENGNGFVLSNDATGPTEAISLLSASVPSSGSSVEFDQGLVGGNAIARITFTRRQ